MSQETKIDKAFKPKKVLSDGMNLKQARYWFKAYKPFMSHIAKAFELEGIEVALAYLEKCSKLKFVVMMATRWLRFHQEDS